MKKRNVITKVLAMLLCVVMLGAFAPAQVYAHGHPIEAIRIQILQDGRYVSQISARLYHNNERIADLMESFNDTSGFNPRELEGLSISDIGNMEVRIYENHNYTHTLATVPLRNFIQYGPGRFFYVLSDINIPNPTIDSLFDADAPFEVLYVQVMSFREEEHFFGIGFYPYSVDGVTIALYHNNEQIRVATSLPRISFENLGLTNADIANMEVRIVDGGGYFYGSNIRSVNYSEESSSEGRLIVFYVFAEEVVVATPQPAPVVEATPEIVEEIELEQEEPVIVSIAPPEPVVTPEPTPVPTPVVEVTEVPTPVAPIIQPTNTATVTNAHFLNLRRGAGVNYQAFAVLSRGDEVTILGQRGGWVNVETARGTGWVFGRYLDI